jgi:hypothetical protein
MITIVALLIYVNQIIYVFTILTTRRHAQTLLPEEEYPLEAGRKGKDAI